MKIREGASFVSAVIIMFTIACGFLFNAQHKKDKEKAKNYKRKHKEQVENKKDDSCYKYFQEIQEEEGDHLSESNQSEKPDDRQWHYYDKDTGQFKIIEEQNSTKKVPPPPNS